MAGIMSVILGLILGTIGLVIIVDTIASGNFTGMLGTVTTYIPVMFAVGLLVLSVSWAQ